MSKWRVIFKGELWLLEFYVDIFMVLIKLLKF